MNQSLQSELLGTAGLTVAAATALLLAVLRRVSDGGPDHPRWVGAVCPNCHRRIHYGKDGNSLNQLLVERLETLEPEGM